MKDMRDIYNDLANKKINELIREQDEIIDAITEFASTIETHGDELTRAHDLSKYEIDKINELRNKYVALGVLIYNIDKTIK